MVAKVVLHVLWSEIWSCTNTSSQRVGVATFKILFAGVAEHIIRLGPEIDLRNDLLSQDFPGDNAPMPPPPPPDTICFTWAILPWNTLLQPCTMCGKSHRCCLLLHTHTSTCNFVSVYKSLFTEIYTVNAIVSNPTKFLWGWCASIEKTKHLLTPAPSPAPIVCLFHCQFHTFIFKRYSTTIDIGDLSPQSTARWNYQDAGGYMKA